MEVVINNLQDKIPVEDGLLALLEQVVVSGLEVSGHRGDRWEVSLALVDDERIRELNYRYRDINEPTDVLSFPMGEGDDADEMDWPPDMPRPLGDIVISLETAARQGARSGHDFSREVAWLAAHGLFHLVGYDHEDDEGLRVMRELEEETLRRAYGRLFRI